MPEFFEFIAKEKHRMKPTELIQFLSIAEKLKCNTRHSWTSDGRHESVAEHSWRLSLMAYLVKDEFPELDMDKVIRMCIWHDMGEAITGDIPAFYKSTSDEVKEEQVFRELLNTLPEPIRSETIALFEEMNALVTPEAKLYKALDKMETLIQHNEADISTWLPLEYEMNLTYGSEEVKFSEYMTRLKEVIDGQTRQKIEDKE